MTDTTIRVNMSVGADTRYNIVALPNATWMDVLTESGDEIFTIFVLGDVVKGWRALRDAVDEHLKTLEPSPPVEGDGESAEIQRVDPVDIDQMVADGAEFVADPEGEAEQAFDANRPS